MREINNCEWWYIFLININFKSSVFNFTNYWPEAKHMSRLVNPHELRMQPFIIIFPEPRNIIFNVNKQKCCNIYNALITAFLICVFLPFWVLFALYGSCSFRCPFTVKIDVKWPEAGRYFRFRLITMLLFNSLIKMVFRFKIMKIFQSIEFLTFSGWFK